MQSPRGIAGLRAAANSCSRLHMDPRPLGQWSERLFPGSRRLGGTTDSRLFMDTRLLGWRDGIYGGTPATSLEIIARQNSLLSSPALQNEQDIAQILLRLVEYTNKRPPWRIAEDVQSARNRRFR